MTVNELTTAQRDTLARLVGGATNKDIASARGEAVDTVKSRLRVLFTRYGVRTRHELALTVITSDCPVPYRPWDAAALSKREVEVLQALAEVDTLQEAADALGLSRLTVKAHLARIAVKAHAHCRTPYLLVRAWRAGLIHYRGVYVQVPPPVPVTFTENVVGGVSTVTCDVCGEVVTAELKHIATRHPEVQS